MKCFYHPTLDAVGYCPACGRPLCSECMQLTQSSGGCPACLAARQAAPTRRSLPTAAMVALGCVAVLLLAIGLGAGGYIYWSRHAPKPPPQPPAVEDTGGPTVSEPSTPPTSSAPSTTAKPGEQAALAFAHSRRPDWVAIVSRRNADATSVTVAMGPTEGDWRTWLELAWDESAGNYRLLGEGPIAAGGPAQTTRPPTSSTAGPSEQAAKRAALELAGVPDWVAKVTEHSPDYSSATVLLGPPASEWVYTVVVAWDQQLGSYFLSKMTEVEYPGE